MKEYIKVTITVVIAILVLGVVFFFFYEGQREARYKDCMYQCETLKHGNCLEEAVDVGGGKTFSGGSQTPCIKEFLPNCSLVCIQKYK